MGVDDSIEGSKSGIQEPVSMNQGAHRMTLLDTVEAADYMHLSPRTLEDYRIKGGGPPFIRTGVGRRARVLYDLKDLNAWLLARKRGSTAEEG